MKEYIELIIDDILDDFTSRERREFVYLACDSIRALKTTEYIISGSFSEGLVNYDDFDFMCFDTDYFIVNSADHTPLISEKSLRGILIIEEDGRYPGFARLLVHKEVSGCPPDDVLFHKLNGKKYYNGQKHLGKGLSNVKKRKYNKYPIATKGPSLKSINPAQMLDMTYCFPLMDIDNIHNEECFQFEFTCANVYLVPKSHTDSTCPEIEFRWSFSVIENRIIRNLTEKEFQLYFICKELYNTYIKSNDDKSCISSYTIKTLIFYFQESYQKEIKSEPMIELVKLFLCDMKLSLKFRYLPQYFIRDYNMFDVLKDDEAKEVLAIIENIETDLILAILKCKFFNKFGSLVTLRSIYETLSRIGDFDNMKEDILKNINIEKSFKYFTTEDDGYIIGKKTSIRDHLNGSMYFDASMQFYRQICYEDYWEVLCLYFHFNTIFKKYYRNNVIKKFKFLFERFLTVYLMGIDLENDHKHIIPLFIERLLHRLIYLPNPIPSICVQDKITLAFYYYLCKKEKKASNILSSLYNGLSDNNGMIVLRQFYPSSILSNDVVLTKYMEKQNQTLPGFNFYFSRNFFYEYTRIRIDGISCQDITELIACIPKHGDVDENERGLLTALKEYLY